jgi:hypothetical protein
VRARIENPYASHPSTDEKIRWSNIHVIHHGGITRQDKVLALGKYLNKKKIYLRVCWQEEEELILINSLNCSKCEKCLRTIAAIVYSGIDPNTCGFQVDKSTFKRMKKLINGKKIREDILKEYWGPLQRFNSEKMQRDLFGSKEFFEWFKNINLNLLAKPVKKPISLLYYKFPYIIYNALRTIFSGARAHIPKFRA